MFDKSPELYLLSYAYPCLEGRVMRGEVPEEAIPKLKKALVNELKIDRSYLEKCFPEAIEGIKEFSKDIWNVKTIKDYFFNHHEYQLMKRCDLTDFQKESCLVYKGTIEKKILDREDDFPIYSAQLENGKKTIAIVLYKNPKIGDKVVIHINHAVELLV